MDNALKDVLDKLYESFDFDARKNHDPIAFPTMYRHSGDKEVAGFIAASLAYGRVGSFMPVVREILSRMGPSPRQFMMDFDATMQKSQFNGIQYRFNRNADIVSLMQNISHILKQHGSLQAAFMRHDNPDNEHTGPALEGFMGMFHELAPVSTITKGYTQFFPRPSGGSACKRANLFLRWMVRSSDIDFGIWSGISPSRLIIPLDTHIARVSRCLGLTGRKSAGWAMALEVTRALRALEPADPLKYDFALCHRGIAGLCNPQKCPECSIGKIRQG